MPDDLKRLHARVFALDQLHIGIVGAVDEEAAKLALYTLFGDLPRRSDLLPVKNTRPRQGRNVHVAYDLPQTSLRLARPGIKRTDPDFFVAYIMNHILGGGSFSSLLYNEIREKRGSPTELVLIRSTSITPPVSESARRHAPIARRRP